MKIEFENLKTNLYTQGNDKTYGTFFYSQEPIAKLASTTICLYDNNPEKDFETEKIYLELANADTPNKALEFCNKYGKLIETDLLKEVYIEIENHSSNTCEISSTDYDYILYNHFRYYQLTIANLAKLFLLLEREKLSKKKASIKPLTDKEIAQLFAHCCHLIVNPYHSDRFQLEISNYLDYDEVLDSLKNYPLVKYIFFITSKAVQKRRETNKPLRLPLSKSASILINFFIKTMPLFTDGITPYIPNDYLVNHRTEFLQFADFVYTQILSFEIRFTHPEISLDSFDNITCWKFHSLSNAIFFYFYIDNSRGNIFDICANELCRKFFSRTRPDKIYCSRQCTIKVTKRTYNNKNK